MKRLKIYPEAVFPAFLSVFLVITLVMVEARKQEEVVLEIILPKICDRKIEKVSWEQTRTESIQDNKQIPKHKIIKHHFIFGTSDSIYYHFVPDFVITRSTIFSFQNCISEIADNYQRSYKDLLLLSNKETFQLMSKIASDTLADKISRVTITNAKGARYKEFIFLLNGLNYYEIGVYSLRPIRPWEEKAVTEFEQNRSYSFLPN